jgi:hypothetical protein
MEFVAQGEGRAEIGIGMPAVGGYDGLHGFHAGGFAPRGGWQQRGSVGGGFRELTNG